EVAGEVEVDLLHRHDLRIAAAGRAALHPETGAERGLTQAEHRLASDLVEAIDQPDRGRRLALAGRRRIDRGYEDQSALGAFALLGQPLQRDLRLGAAIGLDR